jgi:hypothetical protein
VARRDDTGWQLGGFACINQQRYGIPRYELPQRRMGEGWNTFVGAALGRAWSRGVGLHFLPLAGRHRHACRGAVAKAAVPVGSM